MNSNVCVIDIIQKSLKTDSKRLDRKPSEYLWSEYEVDKDIKKLRGLGDEALIAYKCSYHTITQ